MVLPEDEPPEGLYKKEEIQMKPDKIDVLEKRLDMLTNRFETLERSNKSQHEKIWLKLEEGDNDV